MTQPISGRVPNPTAPPHPDLPVVHVHGATSWRRRVVLIALAVAPGIPAFVAVAIAPFEGAMPPTLPTMSGLYAFWLILAARAFPPVAPYSSHVAATLVAVAWAFAAAWASMDRDAVGWSPVAVAVVVASTLAGSWLGWWAAGLRFGVVWPLVRPVPRPHAPTARSAWAERSTRVGHLAALLALAGVASVALVLGGGLDAGIGLWGVPLVIFAVLSALPFTIRITADRRGLRIRSRILGIPLVTVPLERVASASAALIDETEWGQVGSTADRELTTIIHRSGAALIVTRTDGSMVVVTADRPDEAAAVLESLRARPALG